MAIRLFGFTLGKKDVVQVQNPGQPSFALPTETMDDGAITITQNAHYGTYVDLEGSVRNEIELVSRYREMANHPELEMAIDDIADRFQKGTPDRKAVDMVRDAVLKTITDDPKIGKQYASTMKAYNEAREQLRAIISEFGIGSGKNQYAALKKILKIKDLISFSLLKTQILKRSLDNWQICIWIFYMHICINIPFWY